jgi:hypothetical protein
MYQRTEVGPLVAPALIVAFNGWVSAGGAGIATAEHIAGSGPVVARFDSDLLYDYRVNRPTLEFTEGIIDKIEWPETRVRRRNIDGRDLLVLAGPEPNWHWQAFGEAVADLAIELGVVQHVSLGGIPWAAPHTRPTIVVTTSSRPDLLSDDANFPAGMLRVPASAASVVERAVADRGIPTVGFWARVPHYVAGIYHPAVVTPVERVSLSRVELPLATWCRALPTSAANSTWPPPTRPTWEIVTRLEELYDASGEVASGEEIAAEIERYLRDRAPGDDV